MANMPSLDGTDGAELNRSGYSPQPGREHRMEGFRFLPLTGQQLVQFAWNNSANYFGRMTEVATQRLHQQQQHMNELALFPIMDRGMPFYFPPTALTGIPAYDMQTIIGRYLMESLQKPDPIFSPLVQSAAARSTIPTGRRPHERIKSCPATVRRVNANSGRGTTDLMPSPSVPYMEHDSHLQNRVPDAASPDRCLPAVPEKHVSYNDVPNCSSSANTTAETPSTLTTITECAYDDTIETAESGIAASSRCCKESQTSRMQQNIATDTSDLMVWLSGNRTASNHTSPSDPNHIPLPHDSQPLADDGGKNGACEIPEAVKKIPSVDGDSMKISRPRPEVLNKDEKEVKDRAESSPKKSKDQQRKVVTEVKLPPFSPSKSYNFLKSIRCEDIGQRYKADPSKQKNYKRSESAGELPFSILTIREQREYLKQTEDAFVQDAPCFDIARMYGVETSGPLVSQNSWFKCRECRSAKQKESLAVFCRFYGFRKLRFQNNLLCTAGFLCAEDCTEKDLQLWLPQKRCFWEKSKDSKDVLSPNDPLDQAMSDFILLNITKMFCDIVLREEKAISWVEQDEIIFWKKPVAGVREMCDVCETTLFNMHWICRRCGYGVCLDCYERRMAKSIADQEIYDSDKSNCFRWSRCTKGKYHFHSSMLPTQIIPSTCLLDLKDMVHSICEARSIKTSCPCQKSDKPSKLLSKLGDHHSQSTMSSSGTQNSDGCSFSKSRKRKASNSSSDMHPLSGSRPKPKECKLANPPQNLDHTKQPTVCLVDLLSKETWENNAGVAKESASHRNWLCEGKLLQLTDSQHPSNIDVFKLHWKCGMPVLVSGVGKYLDMKLWLPEQLSREYGDSNSKNSLVNCITGSIVTNMKIRDFWDGFENISRRLLDENKKTMILKLKDWPPTESFHDVMPEVFEDLMRALPLPEYTFINGKCNLASRLPHFFVKPDLGPKMYNAYGWVTEKNWKQGTTNLHLDVSDAVNIMVYVGIPVDEPPEAKDTLLQIVSEGEVDDIQFQRALNDKPGALWHIFHVNDVDKIRKFIRKVCAERGETVAPDHDPIHDQQMYLDKELRHRLKEEYNVEGYAILQCQGDGVFIPAGAPHQVFNLHSCIKIAEDFVSPEHVDKCFALTNEFRYLSSTHSNHEDKLQIKNIIYHSVKDIVSSTMHAHCV